MNKNLSYFLTKNSFLVLFVCYMLTSCFSAKPILRMRPVEHQNFAQKTTMTDAFIDDTEDSLQINMQFSHYDEYDEHLVMNVGIINLKTNESVEVYPHKMRYKIFNDSTMSEHKHYLRTKDPYIKIAELDRQQAQARAGKSSAGFWTVLGAVVGVTGTVVKTVGSIKEATQNPQHNDRKQSQSNQNTKNIGSGMQGLGFGIMQASANSAVRNEVTERIAEVEKDYWRNVALHSNILAPQQNVRGNVHFFTPETKSKGIKYCVFEIPLGKKLYKILFCQKWIFPNEPIENSKF